MFVMNTGEARRPLCPGTSAASARRESAAAGSDATTTNIWLHLKVITKFRGSLYSGKVPNSISSLLIAQKATKDILSLNVPRSKEVYNGGKSEVRHLLQIL